MPAVPLHRLDVFTSAAGGGNPAAVVLDAESWTDSQMQEVATWQDCPETAFVLTSASGPARLRWFTPTTEVNFCGHATLAAAHVLDVEAPRTFVYGDSHEVTVRAETVGGERIYFLARPATPTEPWTEDVDALLAALGQPAVHPELPIVRTIDDDLLVPLRRSADVDAVQPNNVDLSAYCRERQLRGVGVIAVPGPGPYEVRARFFTPACGVPEDVGTGSFHGPVAVYLAEAGLLEHQPEELRALSLQGPTDGRQSDLWLRLRFDADGLATTAEVGGRVVGVGVGEVGPEDVEALRRWTGEGGWPAGPGAPEQDDGPTVAADGPLPGEPLLPPPGEDGG